MMILSNFAGRIQHIEDQLSKSRDERDEMEQEVDIEIEKKHEIEKIVCSIFFLCVSLFQSCIIEMG
jgi:hypothetical protein